MHACGSQRCLVRLPLPYRLRQGLLLNYLASLSSQLDFGIPCLRLLGTWLQVAPVFLWVWETELCFSHLHSDSFTHRVIFPALQKNLFNISNISPYASFYGVRALGKYSTTELLSQFLHQLCLVIITIKILPHLHHVPFFPFPLKVSSSSSSSFLLYGPNLK